MDKGLVLRGKPELADFLILAHKVRARDPKGGRLSWMAGDLDNRVVLGVDPNFPFEQVFVLASGDSVNHQTMVGTDILLSEQGKFIICRPHRAVVMSAPPRRLGLALDQTFEDQVANQPGAFFRIRDERLAVGRLILHPYYLLRIELAFIVGDLVGPYRRILLQTQVSKPVMFQQLCEQFVASHALKGGLERRWGFRDFAGARLVSSKAPDHRKSKYDGDPQGSSHQAAHQSGQRCHKLIPSCKNLLSASAGIVTPSRSGA